MKILPLLLSAALAVSAAAATKPAKKKAAKKPQPRTVSLDVKDGEARDILRAMQRQCGIRNLVIDPEVQGSGTFFFRDVPCEQAFPIVLRTMGLAGSMEGNLLSVDRRP